MIRIPRELPTLTSCPYKPHFSPALAEVSSILGTFPSSPQIATLDGKQDGGHGHFMGMAGSPWTTESVRTLALVVLSSTTDFLHKSVQQALTEIVAVRVL